MTDRDAVLRELLTVHVETTRGTSIVATKLLTAAQLHPLVLADPMPPEEDRRLMLRILINRAVASIDGKPMSRDWAGELAGDPALRGVAAQAVNRALIGGRGEGLARFCCPHCQSWEAEMSLGSLAARLGADLGEIIIDYLVAWPTMAQIWPPASRSVVIHSSVRLTALLPSLVLGIAPPPPKYELISLATPAGAKREEQGWERWTGDSSLTAEERDRWDPDAPGFRSILRLSAALLDPSSREDLVSPATIEALPAPDWLFLDALYHLAHHAAVEDPDAAAIRCGRCEGVFLPVR